MNNPESRQESDELELPDEKPNGDTFAKSLKTEPQPIRRRRSDQSSYRGLFGNAINRDKSSGRSRSRGRMSSQWTTERAMVIACFVLLLGVSSVVGYWFGKKSAILPKVDTRVQKYEEIAPSPEAEALVDTAFAELNGGDFRKAFLAFQKVQSAQSTFPGIDFLLGNSALQAGEVTLAKESLERSIIKGEMDAEAHVLMSLITLDESENNKNQRGPNGGQITDPLVTAESELRRYASSHPSTASIYRKWAEIHRQRGSYRTAADLLHKAVLRADAADDISFLSAKETLTKLQNQPAKEAPSLATITSLSGEQAMGAALGALQNKSGSDAVFFLERAKEYFPPRVFEELMKDSAFDEYRSESKLEKFLKSVTPHS